MSDRAIDPRNPVVGLCAEGMRAEGEGRMAAAAALFERAWSARTDAYEACIAAHYVARHQATPEDTLRWNAEALSLAESVEDGRVESFFPSLYLNVAHSHEMLGDEAAAIRFYSLARDRVSDLPRADPLSDLVRRGAAEGMRRLHEVD